ncbi:ferredoxin [compost metagenome]
MGNCEECAEDCPIGAIAIEPDVLPMISDACHGCGVCVSSCYIGALTMIPAEVYQRTL